jgi:hypothetical protein
LDEYVLYVAETRCEKVGDFRKKLTKESKKQ